VTRARIAAVAIGIMVMSVLTGCARDDHTWPGNPEPSNRAVPADTALPPEVMDAWARAASREPGALFTVVGAPVEGWKGPGDRPFEVSVRTSDPEAGHSRSFGTLTMATAIRGERSDLSQYPCSSCHLGRRVVMQAPRISDAHQNIQPIHPARVGSTCVTCHSPDNVEMLTLKVGGPASLDQAYRVCAQCHFRQVDDWAAGAHGKRLDGWQGRRVAMNCTDCHDPHKPAVGTRAPLAGTQLERIGGTHK
jgi:hypothetical protein